MSTIFIDGGMNGAKAKVTIHSYGAMKNKGVAMNRPLDRRTFIKFSRLGVSALSMSSFDVNCMHHIKKRPNILLFVADDAGWRDVGVPVDSEFLLPLA